MALSRLQQLREADSGDYWPGFVDALATLLLVIVFLLAVFVTGQYALSTALTGRDEQLADLNARLAALASELNMAEAENAALTLRVSTLTAENESLSEQLANTTARIGALGAQLDEAEELSDEAQLTIAMLSEQMEILRMELARLNAALEASEAREAELETQVINLGSRLNAALASEVARLAQYRSEFFGRLVEILGNRSGVRVVGDRFVFETDILFDSASAELSPEGQEGLRPIAAAIIQLTREIPDDIEWVIRVDGHTDVRPLGPSAQFSSNWELSTARSLSVINWLVAEGVPPNRLMAAGLGEHYPIAQGRTEADHARNRRIELKLEAR